MPDNPLVKAIKKQLPPPADLRTPAQVKKDQTAKAQQGQKSFQEKITGRKMTDEEYQAGRKKAEAALAKEAAFRKANNVSTDQSSAAVKLKAQYPKELHGLIDSALYIRQKGITPISSGEPGKTWLNKPDIDYVQNALKTPEGRAALEREVRRFKAERGIMSAQYNSGEAKMQRDWSGQMLSGLERDNERITTFLGLDTPAVKAVNDYALAMNPATGPLFGLGQMFPATKDMIGNLVRSTPAMALTGGPQVIGDAGRLLFGIQNPEIAPVPSLVQSGANLGMALIPELGPAAMRGMSKAIAIEAAKRAAMRRVEQAAANAALDQIAGRTLNGFAVEGTLHQPLNQIPMPVETPLSRPIMSQGPGLTVRTDSPDFLTPQAAKIAETAAEIARLEAARAARTAPAPVVPEVPTAPKVKAPEKAPNYYARMKPHEATVTPGKGQEKGFLVTGKSPEGRSLKIFEQDAATAAKMRDNIKAGRDPHEGTKWQHLSSPTPKPVQVKPQEAAAPKPSLKDQNLARSQELEAKPKKNIKGKQAGMANITPEDIELVARKALHAVYTAGEHLHTQIVKIGKELGLNPKQRAKALEMAKGFDPELGKFHFEPKTANAPKTPKVEPVTEPSSREVTGFARQVSGRDAMPGVSREQILKTGQEAINSGRVHPETVAERVLSSGKVASPEETAAMAVRSRELANEFDSVGKAISQEKDKIELFKLSQRQDEILDAMESIDRAGRLTGNTWSKMGQALQIALKKDYSLASLLTRVKAYAGEVTGAHKAELVRLTKLVDEGNIKIDELKNQIATMAASWKTKTPIAKAAKVLANYFGVSAEKAPLISGGIRGKQAGKANYAIPKEEMAAMKAARSMAREAYHDEGITTLDGVLDFIRKESGATEATDEQLLRLLSEPYRAHMLEADIARRKIDQFMRDVKKQAMDKQKPAMAKVMAGVWDTYDAVSRSLQAGGDMSAPFIQGRKGLFANPKSWIEAWGPAMKALWSKGDDVVERYMLDNVERHPMYARSVAAGLDLPEIGGKLTKQEEAFASNLIHVLKDKKLGGGQIYFKFLANTDAAYTVFLNKLRFDTFVKMAKAAPDNPEALRDFANAVNIIYGRGKEGWAVGAAKTDIARRAFFAPRYTVSKWQYANPIGLATNFKTPQGRLAMLKVYGAQAAAYTGLVAMARMAGWEVGVDPRSSDFGKVTLPNGFKVDLFGKEAEAYKLVSQIIYGKVSQAGGFTPKSMDNAGRTTVQYLANKMAPLPRDATNIAFGKFDYKEGKTRPVELRDFGMSKLPFWIQQAIDDGTFQSAPYLVPISAMGIDIQGPGKPKTKTPPPFNPLNFRLGPTESKPKAAPKKDKKKETMNLMDSLAR